ncbi:MAG TPA: DUF192 domain-containing protein [Candidatus Paceibacterota bacterium]|nr:DUF192 domain-containing protein [Candidatus Paceibacterota bacterium]
MNRVSRNIVLVFLLTSVFIGVGFYVYKTYVLQNRTVSQSSQSTQSDATTSNQSLPLDARIISPQGVNISVRVADTDKTRQLGLSYFKSLPDGQGMLFVFPQMGTYSFWMKDMNFPLDVIWIDDNFNIIDRVIDAPPSSYPESFTPSGLARYVLELPANSADRDGFFIGKKIILQQDKELDL